MATRSQQMEQKGHKKKKWLGLGLGLLVGMGSSAIAIPMVVQKLNETIPESVSDVTTYARPSTITIKATEN
ncbi:MAG: hypothetical protein QNJ70_25970 [Xenococcaceae cyanobacterium MO_207.B15]|nr:hypothetical protein [Xenococcaceae cyanobacterium MO_207.B15]MDJ0742965.1 hypothetical protein [Xenococcaceae cyanobacterium MO_167.B27]